MPKVINWKTTIGAIVTLLSQILPLIGIEITPQIQGALITIGIVIVGLFAKDSDVTGGKRAQTSEAKNRAE